MTEVVTSKERISFYVRSVTLKWFEIFSLNITQISTHSVTLVLLTFGVMTLCTCNIIVIT